jgi:hypothetical protein
LPNTTSIALTIWERKETSARNTTATGTNKEQFAWTLRESGWLVNAGLPSIAQAPFLFRQFRLYARIRQMAVPPRALLDDIPACAITLLTGDPDVDHR